MDPTTGIALDVVYSSAIWFEPALATAERFAALGREVHVYHFERVAPGAARSGERAMHTAELPYLFGVFQPGAHDPTDAAVSAEMQHARSGFARSGVPCFLDGERWPRFDAAAPRHAVFGDTTAVRSLTCASLTCCGSRTRQCHRFGRLDIPGGRRGTRGWRQP
jgi:para-nitrobenzyl esterase|nr:MULTISPECIES: carboxylesterase family protein [unclassified Streptomyces]